MNKPRPILLAVRLALYGTAAAPALLATGVGIAHGRVAEPAMRCERGQEVAACGGQAAVDQPELHRHDFELPQLSTPSSETIRQFFASPSQTDYAAEADIIRSIQGSHRALKDSQLLMPAWRGGAAQVGPLREPHQPDAHGDEAGGPGLPLTGQSASFQTGQLTPGVTVPLVGQSATFNGSR